MRIKLMCTLLYTLLLLVRDCDQPTMVTSSSHLVWLLHFLHVLTNNLEKKLAQDLQSTDTRVQFKHSLKSWLFECAGGASDRQLLKARRCALLRLH